MIANGTRMRQQSISLVTAFGIMLSAPVGAEQPIPVQPIIAPENNFAVAMNAIFLVCPGLVQRRFDRSTDFSSVGLRAPDAQLSRIATWQGQPSDGLLFVSFPQQDGPCNVNYAGPYEAISGAVKDVLKSNGFQELPIPAEERPSPGGAYVRFTPDRKFRDQFIIIENGEQQMLTVSFTYKAN